MKNQSGATLVITMIILILLSVLGGITMNRDAVEVKLASNNQFLSESLQASLSVAESIQSIKYLEQSPFSASSVAGMDKDAEGYGDVFKWYTSQTGATLKAHSVFVDSTLAIKDHQLNTVQQACPRSQMGSSFDVVGCEYYQVRGSHLSEVKRTQTTAYIDMSREIVYDASLIGNHLAAINE